MVQFLIISPEEKDDAVQAAKIGKLLHAEVEEAEVSVLCETDLEAVFQGFPVIKWETKRLYNELNNCFFDYIIDFESSWRTLRLKNKLQVLDFTIGQHFLAKKISKKVLKGEALFDEALRKLSVFDLETEKKEE